MQGYHTQWGGHFETFEILCQIASAAAWAHHYGKLDLYADGVSIQRLHDLKVQDMYGTIRQIKICHHRTKRIWAWPKIEAMGWAGAKDKVCCSVDIDCVVWQPLLINPEIALYGLHYDCGQWPVYHELRGLMALIAPKVNFNVQPMNAALMMFRNERLRLGFCDLARVMAESIMALPIRLSKDAGSVSIEQLLAPALVLSMGQRVDVFETIENLDTWRHSPEVVMHLWGTKKIYSSDSNARESLLNHLVKQVSRFNKKAAFAIEAIAAKQKQKDTK